MKNKNILLAVVGLAFIIILFIKIIQLNGDKENCECDTKTSENVSTDQPKKWKIESSQTDTSDEIFSSENEKIVFDDGTEWSIPTFTSGYIWGNWDNADYIESIIRSFIFGYYPYQMDNNALEIGDFKYEYYVNDDIVSLILYKMELNGIDTYRVVNFDKKTLGILSNRDILMYKNIRGNSMVEKFNEIGESVRQEQEKIATKEYTFLDKFFPIESELSPQIYLNSKGQLMGLVEIKPSGAVVINYIEKVVLYD